MSGDETVGREIRGRYDTTPDSFSNLRAMTWCRLACLKINKSERSDNLWFEIHRHCSVWIHLRLNLESHSGVHCLPFFNYPCTRLLWVLLPSGRIAKLADDFNHGSLS